MLKYRFLLILLSSLFLCSCSNELDINADWKDTTVVFGLINKEDNVHYVRISRAFQGEGDALIFAQQADSIYYEPTQLEVSIQETGGLNRTFTLMPDSSISKDPGIFSNPFQVIYKFTANNLNLDAEYTLKVKNLKNDNILTGITKLVTNITVNTPHPLSNPGLPQEIDLEPTSNTKLTWSTGEQARVFEAFFRFKYREHPEGQPGQMVAKVVEMNLGRQTIDKTDGGDDLNASMSNLEIFQQLAAFITPSSLSDPMLRYADSLEFVVNSGSDDYFTYLNVNQPSNTVAQEKPQFNNVENGIGLFSSRAHFQKSLYLKNSAVTFLRTNEITQTLNFQPR